ncbi:MAG: 4Fe-4S binding protein, partial [Candidatus Fermentibacteraceae bacterium]|nr:4Fe-4S binding protein [Candidatus Fermentibacteraceae bacterium]
EAVRSAEAAAGTILSTLVPGREVETEPRTSVISETLCRGCRTCMDVCGFGAISFDSERNVCTVNGVLCKGCGNCAAACPSGAVRSMHFTPDQLRYQMTGALR